MSTTDLQFHHFNDVKKTRMHLSNELSYRLEQRGEFLMTLHVTFSGHINGMTSQNLIYDSPEQLSKDLKDFQDLLMDKSKYNSEGTKLSQALVTE